ncbi:MAG: DUF642 domain-containing protein, partial [Pseudomonadota bacterium]
MDDEAAARVYHSSAVLLRDGTLLTSGGTTGGAEYNGQVYRPDYLYDANGQPATRPEITDVALNVNAGQSIIVKVDDATDIADITLVRGQTSTHSVQMSSGFFKPDFTVLDGTTIEIAVPSFAEGMDPGNWMLFAWNTAGTPSMAPIVRINPGLPSDTDAANLVLNGGFDVGGADALGWVQTENAGRAAPIATEGDAALILGAEGAPGAATQTIATQAGTVYRLSFDLGLIGSADGAGAIVVELSNGDTRRIDIAADGSTTQIVKLGFKASDATTDITLKTADGTPVTQAGYSIDNVELSENMVANHSFEEGGQGPGTYVPHWTALGKGGLRRLETRADDGEASFLFGGWTSGYYGDNAQEIPTIVGQSYTVSFAARANVGRSGNKITVETIANGAVTMSETVALPENKVYADYSFSFTATDSSTILRINNLASEGQDAWDSVYLDTVVVRGTDNPNLLGDGAFEDGTTEQTIATEIGQTYTLRFDANGLSDGQALTVEALAGATVDGTATFDATSGSTNLTFTATSVATTLRFTDASSAPASYTVDVANVALVAALTHGTTATMADGSFEDGTGWTLAGAARLADLSGSDDEYMLIRDGDGTIHQTIATRPGETYTLSFDFERLGFSEYDAVLRVEALNNLIEDFAANVVARADERSVSFAFTATGLNTTIRFSDASAGGVSGRDLKIDNVTVKQGATIAPTKQGTDGNNRMFGAGQDQVYGLEGDDRINITNYKKLPAAGFGGAGDDVLAGRNGWQKLYGEAGDDTLTGGGELNTAEQDTLDGGDGNDLIMSGPDTATNRDWGDLMIGGAGNDTIEGGAASDQIDGG